jgi:hypothetical protein
MGKSKKPDEKAITKSITILPRHEEYIKDTFLNLSKFIQSKLDEEIAKKKGAKK